MYFDNEIPQYVLRTEFLKKGGQVSKNETWPPFLKAVTNSAFVLDYNI